MCEGGLKKNVLESQVSPHHSALSVVKLPSWKGRIVINIDAQVAEKQ